MADQSQLFSFLSLADSESGQSTMSGILTIGTHEKDPCRGQTAVKPPLSVPILRS